MIPDVFIGKWWWILFPGSVLLSNLYFAQSPVSFTWSQSRFVAVICGWNRSFKGDVMTSLKLSEVCKLPATLQTFFFG